MNKNEVAISYAFLRKSALIFIALPLLCFFIGWLRWYWAVLSCLALFTCVFLSDENSKITRKMFLKRNVNRSKDLTDFGINEKRIVISRRLLFSIIVVSCIYLILCGIGRLWAQSADYPWRNAIFRDLIVRDWPVFYDKFDGALCYYFGMWLPAAIPGKMVYFVSGSQSAAFFAGNIAFLLYYTIGLSILFLLLLIFFNSTNAKSVFTIILGFVFFSGMDILGVFLMESYSDFKDLHIEWWSGFHQYSSLTTLVCWVFNQALIPWICMMIILLERKLSSFVFIGMACLFCGPFPFIGFFV